nr:trypsin-7-like [Onthophagus taurus]
MFPFPDGRIVGGESVNIEDYPYQVQLLYWELHICGGSIISSRYIVTAAHCTNGTVASELSIRYGTSIRNDGGDIAQVATLYQHPEYDEETADFDISLLKLGEDLLFADKVQPIKLPSLNEAIPVGELCVVTGWGRLEHNGVPPLQLQAVRIPIITLEQCREAYAVRNLTVSDRMICAAYPSGGKDACQGDSGGSLVVDDVLFGIVSWGIGCADPNFPGVYASVSALRSYITEISGI